MQFLQAEVPGLGARPCLAFQTAFREVDPPESIHLDSEPDLPAVPGDGLSEQVHMAGP